MIARKHHRVVVLVKGETVVGTFRKFERRHVVVLRRGFAS